MLAMLFFVFLGLNLGAALNGSVGNAIVTMLMLGVLVIRFETIMEDLDDLFGRSP